MKKISKILAISLALTFLVCSIFSVSAAKYVAKPVSESFETKTDFLQPGDIDLDGDVDNDDYASLREMLLYSAASLYSDANGDENTNICDLVLQDKNKDITFLKDGAINLNGRSLYRKNLKSVLNSGAEYKITYTSSGNVTVKLEGMNDYNGAKVEITGSGYTFKTPTNLSNIDVLLYVVGEGTVENLAITRINMDNDYAVN